MNLFRYAANRPIHLVDPFGLEITYPESTCKNCCCLLIRLEYPPRSIQGRGEGGLAGNDEFIQSLDALKETDEFKANCPMFIELVVTDVTREGDEDDDFNGFNQLSDTIAAKLKAAQANGQCKGGVKHIIILGHGTEPAGGGDPAEDDLLGMEWPNTNTPVGDEGEPRPVVAEHDRLPGYRLTDPARNARDESYPLKRALFDQEAYMGEVLQIDLEGCYSASEAARMAVQWNVTVGGYTRRSLFGTLPPHADTDSEKKYFSGD
jgi:hypothetical protein